MKNGLWIAGALAFCLSLGFAGCSVGEVRAADGTVGDVSIREAVTRADPQAAVDAVYETLPDARTTRVDAVVFTEKFPGLSGKLGAYYGCVSDVNGGLADLLIFEPAEGSRDDVRNALLSYQESRIKEFENYDILDAFEIAKSALVYDQGDYIILTMLPDNEAAQDIIDLHIPL